MFDVFGVEREIDNHDRVLLDDSDKQDHAKERIEVEILAKQQQGEQRSDSRRWQTGKNGQRMNEALVKNAKNEINDHDRDQKQNTQPLERTLELRSGSLEGKGHRRRHSNFLGGASNKSSGGIKRNTAHQIELECHSGELSQMVD